MSYRDGVMEHEPKACAAVKGTQIMVFMSLEFLNFVFISLVFVLQKLLEEEIF